MGDRRVPYLQVADALRQAIRAGTFAPGDRLPTVAELADQYRVAKMTVQRALTSLRDEGLVISWQGRGTFVRQRDDDHGVTGEGQSPYETIMRRLDLMGNDLRRLEDRVARLEAEQPAAPDESRRRLD
ncbi:MAG TPA: GntR family transcriptional regulator [Micromonosporaceae bacterium]